MKRDPFFVFKLIGGFLLFLPHGIIMLIMHPLNIYLDRKYRAEERRQRAVR